MFYIHKGSRYSGAAPHNWQVREVAKETPQRFYYPPYSSYPPKPYNSKDECVERPFETREQAEAYKAAAIEAWNRGQPRTSAAKLAHEAAEKELREARAAQADALTAFLKGDDTDATV